MARALVNRQQKGGPIQKYQIGAIVKNVAKGIAKKITKFSSEAERIAAGQKTNLQNAKEASMSWEARQGSDYHKAGLKKAIETRTNPAAASKKMTRAQRDEYNLEQSYRKKGGSIKKYASGGKFPDLTGDGKVTKADILKGRGVIKKTGGSKLKK